MLGLMSSSKAQELRRVYSTSSRSTNGTASRSTHRLFPGSPPCAMRAGSSDRRNYACADAVLDFWLTAGRFSEEFEGRLAEFLG